MTTENDTASDMITTPVVGSSRLLWSLVFTILCTTLGVGILGLPGDLVLLGWVPGIFFLIFFGFMALVAVWCLCHVVISLQDELGPSWQSSYPGVGKRIFGFWGQVSVIFTQQLTCLLVCTLYTQQAGHNIRNFFEKSGVFFMFGDTEQGSSNAGFVYTSIFAFCTGIILVCYRGFREAPWLTITGALMTILVAILSIISVCVTPAPEGSSTSTVISTSSFLDAMMGTADISTAFACAIIIPEAMSETPRRANVMLPTGASYAMVFATCLYVLTACVGYGVYGEYIGAGGSMLDALGYGAPAVIAWVFIVLHFIAGFVVVNTPLMLQLEEWAGVPRPFAVHDAVDLKSGGKDVEEAGVVNTNSNAPITSDDLNLAAGKAMELTFEDTRRLTLTWKQRMISIAIRVGVICLEVFIGILIPFFGTLLGLVGALSILASSFFLPYLFYLKRFWHETTVFMRTVLIFLTIAGVFFSITGLISSIDSIVASADSWSFF